MSTVSQQDLDDILNKVRDIITTAPQQSLGNIENLTVKELRLKAGGGQLSTNDEKASILSVVVYVVVT
jgi:hypothetical protein